MENKKQETPKRRVERSACGTYDYIFEGTETICTMRVPTIETPEYSRRAKEIVDLPQLSEAMKEMISELRQVEKNLEDAAATIKAARWLLHVLGFNTNGGGA